MSRTIVLTLDDDVGEYLERLASGQGRTPADVAAWIVTEDLRREQAIDAELVARLDDHVAGEIDPSDSSYSGFTTSVRRERTGG